MSNSRHKYRSQLSRLTLMVKDLQAIRDELIPRGGGKNQENELKGLDDFEKMKLRLNGMLHDIRKQVNELNEMRKARQQRDTTIISMQNQNHLALREAKEIWVNMKKFLEKAAKKKKTPKEELEERIKMVEGFGTEIMRLEQQNSSARSAYMETDATDQEIERAQKIIASREKRKQDRQQRANERAANISGRGGAGGGNGYDGGDEFHPVQISAQEQAFFERKAVADQKIDELYDVISAGLSDLKAIAVDINQNLDMQNELLDEVQDKMDDTIADLKTTNKKLKELIDTETGGATKWCPMLVAFLILLGIVGYLISSTQ